MLTSLVSYGLSYCIEIAMFQGNNAPEGVEWLTGVPNFSTKYELLLK